MVVPLNKIEDKEHFREGVEVKVLLTRESKDIKDVFGALKNWNINSQKFKDKIRKEETNDLLS